MFVGLSFGALRRLAGWMRLLPLPPIAYIAWRAFDELAPALLHAGELDTAEFQRLLYERWSALSRPALYASALMLGLPVGDHAWKSVVWCVGILIIAIPLAAILFRRKTTN